MLFPVSLLKLFVMGTATLGLYQLHWFAQNWKFLNEGADRQASPFWRTFFAPFFCYSLFREIKETCVSQGAATAYPSALLAMLWIAFTAASLFTTQFILVIALSSLTLLPVQAAANRLNAIAAPDHDRNTRFSPANIIGIAFGIGVSALMILLSGWIDLFLKDFHPQ